MAMQGEPKERLLHDFCAFHSQFQSRRVPLDLIERACQSKLLWSSSGSLDKLDPVDGSVPSFLLDFWKTFQYSLNTGGISSNAGYVKLRITNGVRYVELDESYYALANPSEGDQELISQCVHAFIHAFPSRNAEILGEETAKRLMPLAASFLMPLLASITTEDIKTWLLPTDKDSTTDYVISLCDCLQQTALLLGRDNPLIPLGFLDRMCDALGCDSAPDMEEVESPVAIIKMTKASITLRLGHLVEVASGIYHERNNAWLGSLFTLLPDTQIPDECLKFKENWKPLSKSDPSAMEYLVAVELLPEEQLNYIPVSTSLSHHLSVLRGLLFSRKGLHDAAARILFDHLSTIITTNDISLEAGIVAAECANCYNMLRQEEAAGRIATRFLALRESQELLNREDWFFLSLSLIDSLIGVGKYEQADLRLQSVIAKPSVPTSIYAMSCLRLSKIRRRTSHDLNTQASHGTAPYLQSGIELFAHVPKALQQEILEETSCQLLTKHDFHKGIEQVEPFLNTMNSHLSTMTTDTTPAQSRYERIQSSVKQRILHEKDAVETSPKRRTQANDSHNQSTFPLSTLPEFTPVSDGKGSKRMFMVPQPRNPGFVFRDEVTAITKFLSERPQAPNKCLLYGEAGIGKSSIATEVVYSCRQNFDVIIWIESGSTSEVNHRLYSIVAELGMYRGKPDKRDLMETDRRLMTKRLNWLLTGIEDNARTVKYLVVFDDIASKEDLEPFWSSDSTPCSVLITARNNIYLPGIDNQYASPQKIKVGPLSSQQAMLVHGYYMGWSYIKSKGLSPESLGGHPLAIKKAGELAEGLPFSAWHIDDDFEQNLKFCLDHEQFTTQPNHSASLIKLWFYFFASPKAIDLLNVISYFEEIGTPGLLLSSYTLPPRAPNKLVIMMDEFKMARNELLEFSLIWRDHEIDILRTSPNIRALVRGRIPPERFETVYAKLLSLIIPCLGI